jgi:hypothetical protein
MRFRHSAGFRKRIEFWIGVISRKRRPAAIGVLAAKEKLSGPIAGGTVEPGTQSEKSKSRRLKRGL